MPELFATYKKEVETTWIKTTHRIRIRIGFTAADILASLKDVPKNASVHEIIGDQDHDDFPDCGEIVLTEEREC